MFFLRKAFHFLTVRQWNTINETSGETAPWGKRDWGVVALVFLFSGVLTWAIYANLSWSQFSKGWLYSQYWVALGIPLLALGVFRFDALKRLMRDWRAVAILVAGVGCLTVQEVYGTHQVYWEWFGRQRGDMYASLKGYAWWSGWRFIGYVVLPILVVLILPKERLRDYFVSFRDFLRHAKIYLLLYILILPAVIIASRTESFSHTYPFYKLANRSAFDFWVWQGLYALQFLSLEFFFRGFLLKGCQRALGSHAIFFMIVPYCVIHFGKPAAETLGALGAGVILGTLAMRTRSIWGGVLLHVGVALTMDLLAVQQCPEPPGRCPSH